MNILLAQKEQDYSTGKGNRIHVLINKQKVQVDAN